MLVLIVAVMKFSRFNNASYLHLYRLPPVGIGIIDEPCSPTCCGESCNVGLNQPLLAAFWPIDLVEISRISDQPVCEKGHSDRLVCFLLIVHLRLFSSTICNDIFLIRNSFISGGTVEDASCICSSESSVFTFRTKNTDHSHLVVVWGMYFLSRRR